MKLAVKTEEITVLTTKEIILSSIPLFHDTTPQ